LDQFTALLKATKPGDTIVLGYRRKNAPAGGATITLGSTPDTDYGFPAPPSVSASPRTTPPAGVATITLGSNPDRDYGYLGVGVLDAPWAPFAIDFNLANIGGAAGRRVVSLAVRGQV